MTGWMVRWVSYSKDGYRVTDHPHRGATQFVEIKALECEESLKNAFKGNADALCVAQTKLLAELSELRLEKPNAGSTDTLTEKYRLREKIAQHISLQSEIMNSVRFALAQIEVPNTADDFYDPNDYVGHIVLTLRKICYKYDGVVKP